MKFTVRAADLAAATASSGRIIDEKAKIPILLDIKVEAEDDAAAFTVTDLDIERRTECTAEVIQRGATTIQADRLTKLASGLAADAVVSIEVNLPAPVLPANGKGAQGVIVPTAACEEIGRLAKSGDLTVYISAKGIAACGKAGRVTSRLIDGVYPDYPRVIPAASPLVTEC